MNREKRRHPRNRDEPRPQQAKEVTDKATPPDVTSVRAKSTGHGKKTADKWNQ